MPVKQKNPKQLTFFDRLFKKEEIPEKPREVSHVIYAVNVYFTDEYSRRQGITTTERYAKDRKYKLGDRYYEVIVDNKIKAYDSLENLISASKNSVTGFAFLNKGEFVKKGDRDCLFIASPLTPMEIKELGDLAVTPINARTLKKQLE